MDRVVFSLDSPFGSFTVDSDEDFLTSSQDSPLNISLSSSNNVGGDFIVTRNSNDDLNARRVEDASMNMRTDCVEDSKKQKKSVIPFLMMIKIFLSAPNLYRTGITWLKEGVSFLINWDIFCELYRFLGNTDAKDESVKRRFMGPKCKFTKSTDVFVPGYDVVFTWEEDKIPTSLVEASLGVDANILINPTCMVDKYTFFSIHEFIDRLRQHLPCTNADLFNVKQLLLIESKESDRISLSQFVMFLSKFGPLSQCLAKVREFVNTDICNWYYGAISKEDAEKYLVGYWKLYNKNCFLLRAAQPSSNKTTANIFYIFAVSFLYQHDGKARVCHMRLYRNSLFQLVQCVPLGNDQYLEKPVRKFLELFLVYGDPVILQQRPMFVKEEIPVNPDTSPWQGGYMPTGNPYQI